MKSTNEQASECKLWQETRYLHISIPCDEDEVNELIPFYNGLTTELHCEVDFVPPMFNSGNRTLEVMVDLAEHKVIDWSEEKGFIHMWGKVIDYGTYTLIDASMKLLFQIRRHVPNA